jgi:hypothetical protein
MTANDTAALVVALSAQVSKFQKDMDQANAIASKSVKQIEDKFAQANISLGKLTAGTLLGNLLTDPLQVAIDKVKELGDEFTKTASLAKFLQISITRVQELQFGAALKGVDFATFRAESVQFLRNAEEAKRALDEVGTLSAKQINRIENDFARLFRANGISITDNTGKLLAFDELLLRAADLVKNAKTELDKIKIAEMLGLSRDWVRALQGGRDGLRSAAEEAHRVGAVVDTELIKSAKEFDTAWEQAIVRLKGAFKGLVADVKLLFADLFDSIQGGAPKGFVIADVPASSVAKLKAELERLKAEEPSETLLFKLFGFGDARTRSRIDAEIKTIEEELKFRLGQIPAPLFPPRGGAAAATGAEGATAGGGTAQTGGTVIPFRLRERETAFDTEVKQIEKRTKLLDAETKTIGENTFAKDKAKATTELMTAAEQAGLTVTANMSKQIEKVATAYAVAAQNAETAKNKFDGINESLRFFGNQTATILDGLLNKTTTWSAAMQQALRALQAELIKAGLTGEGSFAKALGTASTTGGVGGLAGLFSGLFRAGGGSVMGGQPYIVGEHGPELFMPGTAGMVIPNEAIGRGGGGSPSVNIVNNIDASGADPAAISRLSAGLIAINASIESRVVSGLAKHRALVG